MNYTKELKDKLGADQVVGSVKDNQANDLLLVLSDVQSCRH